MITIQEALLEKGECLSIMTPSYVRDFEKKHGKLSQRKRKLFKEQFQPVVQNAAHLTVNALKRKRTQLISRNYAETKRTFGNGSGSNTNRKLLKQKASQNKRRIEAEYAGRINAIEQVLVSA